MNFKQLIRDYFTFSRNERKGITILIILIFLLAIANKVIFYFETPGKIDKVLLDSASSELGMFNDSLNQQIKEGGTLFPFDPNTIDSIELYQLDFPDQVKRNLLRFRNKGGKWFSKSDFRKIYGVTDDVYMRVEPYLVIEDNENRVVSKVQKVEKFYFDPNTAIDDEFVRLGLTAKQIATIRKYQSKGGTFRSKEDFLKIWGLRNDQKSELANFIRIEIVEKIPEDSAPIVNTIRIELNSADSVQLKALPGIGDKLSKRIVKYRDLVGGFYSIHQLTEVYGMSEQTIQVIAGKITVDPSKIRKIDLNFADIYELSKHPYLQKDLAKQIITFRTKHGSFRDKTVLLDSMILNIDQYNRIKPYL
jgi:DNA uptake protein ComE-like DNA-binding protein